MRIKAKIANKSAEVPKLYTGGWISVKERLPDEELKKHKEKYPDESYVEVNTMIKGGKESTTLCWNGFAFSDLDGVEYPVGFWQPLPLPPMPLKNALNCRCCVYPNNVVLRKNAVMQKLYDEGEAKAYQIVAQMEGIILPEKLLQERETVDEQLELIDKKKKAKKMLAEKLELAEIIKEINQTNDTEQTISWLERIGWLDHSAVSEFLKKRKSNEMSGVR